MYTPFFIRDPLSGARLGGALGGDAHISKVWSGFKKECCTDADNFQATFPSPSHLTDLPLALAPDCAQLACTLTLRVCLHRRWSSPRRPTPSTAPTCSAPPGHTPVRLH